MPLDVFIRLPDMDHHKICTSVVWGQALKPAFKNFSPTPQKFSGEILNFCRLP